MNQKIVFFWNWSKSLMQKASSMDVVQKRFIWKIFLPEEESSLSWTVAPPSKKLTWSLAHSTKKPSQKLNRALDPNIDPAAATAKFMLTRFVVVSSNKALANKWNLDWSRCNLQTARLAIILILEILDLDSSKFFPIKVLMNLKLKPRTSDLDSSNSSRAHKHCNSNLQKVFVGPDFYSQDFNYAGLSFTTFQESKFELGFFKARNLYSPKNLGNVHQNQNGEKKKLYI